jgi:hypothetical protein
MGKDIPQAVRRDSASADTRPANLLDSGVLINAIGKVMVADHSHPASPVKGEEVRMRDHSPQWSAILTWIANTLRIEGLL